ncbi:hypothetical protein ADEAN_000011700 [Angomonas deanei]|uniref:Uncharacterized protein n=1 Tax=Angomonas deanei TaxID=59799 RepID=A0A7G2BZJ1_9TRYP|nr:hypothetical protein ADEAN_000011700 [Angomonas deanei]
MLSIFRKKSAVQGSALMMKYSRFASFAATAPLYAAPKASRKPNATQAPKVVIPSTQPEVEEHSLHEDVLSGTPTDTLETLLQQSKEVEDLEADETVSHAEEEVLEAHEGDDSFATDLESLDEATTLTPQVKSKKSKKTRKAKEDAASEETVEPQQQKSEGPTNLSGSHFEGELGEKLDRFVKSRGLTSNIFSTRLGYSNLGVTVNATDADGVEMHVHGRPTYMFNVLQTSLSSFAEDNADDKVLEYLKKLGRLNKTGMNRAYTPKYLSTKPLSGFTKDLVMNSETYLRTRDISGIWLTLEEVVNINASVKADEVLNGVIAAVRSAPYRFDSEELGEKLNEYSEKLGVNAMCTPVFYNLSQLDDEERFKKYYTGFKTLPVTCNGRPYLNATSFLMCEYCDQYELNTRRYAIFVTADRVKQQGGSILETVGEHSPPPFTTLFGGDVVSLYHADQTTIAGPLYNAMFAAKQKDKDVMRAKYQDHSTTDEAADSSN